MTIGPKSRNYNITLHGRTLNQQSSNGQLWSTNSDVVSDSRNALLTVTNPWRAAKPTSLPPTSRNLVHRAWVAPTGEVRWVAGGLYLRTVGTQSGIGTLTSANYGTSVRSQLVNEAVLDALKRLKNQEFNAGVALAESEGVARMLVDAVSTVHDVLEGLHRKKYLEAYRRFRRSKVGSKYHSYPRWRQLYWEEVKHIKSVQRARKIPEGWLYYHYGLKPTVNDFESICNDLAVDRQNPDLMNGQVMGYAKYVTKQQTQYNNVGNVYYDVHLSQLESVRVYLKVEAKSAYLAKASALGVTNPPEAVWNRIPFSFLVDYFFSVGDFLSALDSSVGWEFGDSLECYRKVTYGKMTSTSRRAGTYFLHVAPGTYKTKTVDRVVKNLLYSPMANVLPRLKLRNPSATQIANILSLVATGFKRTVRP